MCTDKNIGLVKEPINRYWKISFRLKLIHILRIMTEVIKLIIFIHQRIAAIKMCCSCSTNNSLHAGLDCVRNWNTMDSTQVVCASECICCRCVSMQVSLTCISSTIQTNRAALLLSILDRSTVSIQLCNFFHWL